METAVIINPDRFVPYQPKVGRPLSPTSVRRKLRAAGLDERAARAPKPKMPKPRIDFENWARQATQHRWTTLLLRMVSEERR